MPHTTLIVPGFHGSGPDHWQTWIEGHIRDARRVVGIDWEKPVLAQWAQTLRTEIDRAHGRVWIIAHSFGCLAAVLASTSRPERVAGLMLVAPADPERFGPRGLRKADDLTAQPGLSGWIPRTPLAPPSVVVASTNDPWVRFSSAMYWADCWGSQFENIGPAGHINVDSGHGPWPAGLALYEALRMASADVPLGRIPDYSVPASWRDGQEQSGLNQ